MAGWLEPAAYPLHCAPWPQNAPVSAAGSKRCWAAARPRPAEAIDSEAPPAPPRRGGTRPNPGRPAAARPVSAAPRHAAGEPAGARGLDSRPGRRPADRRAAARGGRGRVSRCATRSSPASDAGEPRRWRACTTSRRSIRRVPDEAAVAMSLIENIQRENLNPLEEARALDRLIREFGMTHQRPRTPSAGRAPPSATCCACSSSATT